jgi:hypothetical protein
MSGTIKPALGRQRPWLVVPILSFVAAAAVSGYASGHSSGTTDEEISERASAQSAQARRLYEARERRALAAQEERLTRRLDAAFRRDVERAFREGRAVFESKQARRAAAATQQQSPKPLVCDGAVADDAQYAECLRRSGEPVPPGFPGGPSESCPSTGPCTRENPLARP